AWTHYVRRNSKLAEFPMVPSQAVVDGRQFHRIAIAGFGDRSGARQLCERIQAIGGACFVRLGGAEAAPSRWALAKKPSLLAMR
ncbi:MAG: SPOR domain-containing protein, partial [Sphingobium sp.]